MQAQKLSLPAAALAIAVGGFAVGQKISSSVSKDARVQSLTFAPLPTLAIVVPGSDGQRRYRVVCGAGAESVGQLVPEADGLCVLAKGFADAASQDIAKIARAVGKLSK